MSVPLVITEGPVKGMVLSQAGAHPIAPVGVWTVTVKSGQGDAADEQEEEAPRAPSASSCTQSCRVFNLAGRKVFLAFDADRKQNPHVRHAEIRAWMALFTAGADVFQLCTWELKEGKGSMTTSPAGSERTRPSNARFTTSFSSKPSRSSRRLGIRTSRRSPWNCTAPRTTARSSSCSGPSSPALQDSQGFIRPVPQRRKGIAAAAKTIPPTAKPWDEPVKAKEVLDEICTTIRRFESLKPSQCRAVALWIVLTYLHDAVDILPILLITSPEQTAEKQHCSRWFYILATARFPRGIPAAAIYRTIKDIAPTMTLDEADSYLRDNEEMRGVIDSGHQREFAWIIRTAQEGEDTVYFSTWCPKALAMIGLPARTILSRAIHIRLDRKPSG